MRRVLKRKELLSLLSLASLVLLLALGGFSVEDPEARVASPFAPPSWLAPEGAPPSVEVRSEGALSLDYPFDPPAELRIFVSLREPASRAFLDWRMPDGTLLLIPLGEGKSFSLDSRDPRFRALLGVSPFENPAALLLSQRGRYEISVEGGELESLRLTIPGGRGGVMGCDHLGRDLLSLWLVGGRASLLVGLLAALVATALGLLVGTSCGMVGGIYDFLVMRAVDVLMSLPVLPLLFVAGWIFGRSLIGMTLVIGLLSWMSLSRVVRSRVLSIRSLPYVEVLRMGGVSLPAALLRHVLPQVMPLALVYLVLGLPGAVMAEASLSFLGLGDPSVPSWGRMIGEARSFGALSAGAWWAFLFPGLGIAWLCSSALLLGRALQDRYRAGI